MIIARVFDDKGDGMLKIFLTENKDPPTGEDTL
jgi:hypothetical protein